MKPGYNEQVDIYAIDERICQSTAKFMGTTLKKGHAFHDFADVGERNKKVEIIEKELSISFTQLIADDFNFDFLKSLNGNEKFDVITCFEVIEHLQNPLFLVKQLAEMLRPDGVIFLSTPARPKIFWPDFHYYEMNEKHLDKWIFSQVNLEIIRSGKLKIHLPLLSYFTGFRPFARLFINYTHIYELRFKH